MFSPGYWNSRLLWGMGRYYQKWRNLHITLGSSVVQYLQAPGLRRKVTKYRVSDKEIPRTQCAGLQFISGRENAKKGICKIPQSEYWGWLETQRSRNSSGHGIQQEEMINFWRHVQITNWRTLSNSLKEKSWWCITLLALLRAYNELDGMMVHVR